MARKSPDRDRDDPRINPRLGGRTTAPDRQKFPRLSAGLLRRLGSELGGRRAPRRQRSATCAAPGPRDRRCIIKAHVARSATGGNKAHKMHLDYIERDGVERDGSPGKMYSADAETLERARAPLDDDEKHVFRFVISPEDGGELDLEAFARELVRESEKAVGRKFVWSAVNHYDTDNPHLHLVIRGLDKDGEPLHLDPQFISHGMRHRAQRIATLELGERTDFQLRKQVAREIGQERWTSLDRDLERFLQPQTPDLAAGSIPELELRQLTPKDPRRRDDLIARLQTLEKLGLVKRAGRGRWSFEPLWKERLKTLGTRGDVVARIHAALKRGGDTSRYHDGPPAIDVDAVIRKKGLVDELTGRQYVILETPSGYAYHVRVPDHQAQLLSEGQLVRLSRRATPRATELVRQLCAYARSNGGLFDAAAFVAASPTPEADRPQLRAAVDRALKRLERDGYLERAGEGAWKVKPGRAGDLYAELLSLDAREPVFEPRLRVGAPSLESMIFESRHTWLDEQLRRPAALYGLGAELADVLERRRTFLRTNLGLDPSDPDLRRQLTRVERKRAAAAASALLRGATYVPAPRDGFTGRVVSSRSARFLCVHDEAGKRFALIPATAANRAHLDQVVSFSKDATGRVSLSTQTPSRSL